MPIHKGVVEAGQQILELRKESEELKMSKSSDHSTSRYKEWTPREKVMVENMAGLSSGILIAIVVKKLCGAPLQWYRE